MDCDMPRFAARKFDGKPYRCRVVSYSEPYHHVQYSDGDSEDVSEDELAEMVALYEMLVSKGKMARGEDADNTSSKQKKMRKTKAVEVEDSEDDENEEVEVEDSEDDENEEYEIGEILAHKMEKRRMVYLTTWKGYDDTTWEPRGSFTGQANEAPPILMDYEAKHGIKVATPKKRRRPPKAQVEHSSEAAARKKQKTESKKEPKKEPKKESKKESKKEPKIEPKKEPKKQQKKEAMEIDSSDSDDFVDDLSDDSSDSDDFEDDIKAKKGQEKSNPSKAAKTAKPKADKSLKRENQTPAPAGKSNSTFNDDSGKPGKKDGKDDLWWMSGKKDSMAAKQEPINNPQNFRLSYGESAKLDFLDPCGQEISDGDVIHTILEKQYLKVGELLGRAFREKTNKYGNEVLSTVKLLTACSGTDAPALAIQSFQEIAEKYGKAFDQEHLMSCEIEPFKQAYIQNNFDPIIYPDIAKLSTTENPRDIFGTEQPIPDGNMFVAGTVCKNFSMMRSSYRIDIEDKGASGETFLAAVDFLEKRQPACAIFENVIGAPWEKMSEYITGRVPVFLSENSTKKLSLQGASSKDKQKARNVTFVNEKGKYVADSVGGFYGIKIGAVLKGIHRIKTDKFEPISWKAKCTSVDLITFKKLHSCVEESETETDILVFDKPTTYKTEEVKVDTKDFGLPQTRQRTYMLVWKTNDVHDDLGKYWKFLVEHLKSPVQHSLEAFIFDEDHEVIRRFREALLSGPGRFSTSEQAQQAYYWEAKNNQNLPHNKWARLKGGYEDEARFATSWHKHGYFRVPPHWWGEHAGLMSHREKDMLDILHMAAMRDAEAHDASFCSFFWNISQNVSKEKHRGATNGVAGCITPGGDVFLPHLGRPLLGPEKLLLQGIPYHRLNLSTETEVNMSDLAGNAMSVSVVSACILAFMSAKQLRKECKIEEKKNTKLSHNAIVSKVLETANISKEDRVDIDKKAFSPPQGDDAMGVFMKLVDMSEDAFESSVLCTCESSGRTAHPANNRFIICRNCGVSVCASCIDKYNISSHKNEDIGFRETGMRTDPLDFDVALRTTLPSQLYLPREAVEQIMMVDNDKYLVDGLQNFIFQLHRVKRNRHRWTAWYSAKSKIGTGDNVAQIVVHVGALTIGAGMGLGLEAFLHCYQPTLKKNQRGKMEACAKLVLQKNQCKDGFWQILQEASTLNCQLNGSHPEPSTRRKMGILPNAEEQLKETSQRKCKDRDIELGHVRRWEYPKGWQQWPGQIDVTGAGDLDGVYHKVSCTHTTPQSALWKRSGDRATMYIFLYPNVSRFGPDVGAISSSPSYTDSTFIHAFLDAKWQPNDTLIPVGQGNKVDRPEGAAVENGKQINWRDASKEFQLIVPNQSITTRIGNLMQEPKATDSVTVGTLEGFSDEVLDNLTAFSGATRNQRPLQLNLYNGIDGMKTARVFASVCSPELQKIVSKLHYKFDDRDSSGWLPLKSNNGFGFDATVCPGLPVEKWYLDEERTEHSKQKIKVYQRRPDPDESREFKRMIAQRKHGWECFVGKDGEVSVNILPHVPAHQAANALLQGRCLEDEKAVKMEYRLSDVKTQADPETAEFRIRNTEKYPPTYVDLKGEYKLYPRQAQGLTKLLMIEKGEMLYEETEMSEKELPGVGWTLNSKASRNVPLRGGVCADAIGAGKTVISISLILKGLEESREFKMRNVDVSQSSASLIVVPPGLIDQWADEFAKFVPTEERMKIIKIYNVDSVKKLKAGEIANADVVIMPIDILEGEGTKKALYMKWLFEQTCKLMDSKALKDKKLAYDISEAPELPRKFGARESLGVYGVWFSNSSADPYGGANGKQENRDKQGYFTHRYAEILELLRMANISVDTKGMPIEFFTFERVIVDEIHESLCTTKMEMEEVKYENEYLKAKGKYDESMDFKERNRAAARELLGIAQHDAKKRPLRARKCTFGLTGTPLLDSEARVIELANLMGGTYITSQRSHWRKRERDSGRDFFLQLWLEPTRSRMYRREKHEKAGEWIEKGVQRNKAIELDCVLMEVIHEVEMSPESGEQYLLSTPAAIRNFTTMPPDFDANAGQDPVEMLRCNSGELKERAEKLVKIVDKIQEKEPGEFVIVFADATFGAYRQACTALKGRATYLEADDDVETQNRKIASYKTIDATEEDKKRPRVLILTFQQCAGLNLQTACRHVVLFCPLYNLANDAVQDCSSELQAVGRVYRTGQTRDVCLHRILAFPPKDQQTVQDGEVRCLDRWTLSRNTHPDHVAMATNSHE